jgi:hypothetical protein
MKNIICIDLTKYTLEELKEVGEEFDVPFFYINDLKGNPGEEVYFAKMWFDTLNQEVVGYASISEPDKFVVGSNYSELIAGIVPVELKVATLEELEIELNEAILNEAYERATEIREKINKVKARKIS